MIGWLLVLSFVLGFALTWLYMVRSVSRTVEPVAAARARVRTSAEVGYASASRGVPAPTGATRAPHHEGGSRVVEFEDD